MLVEYWEYESKKDFKESLESQKWLTTCRSTRRSETARRRSGVHHRVHVGD